MLDTCGRGWGERCATANPDGPCVCSCGGENHGIYAVFKNLDSQPPRIKIPPPSAPGGDDYDTEIILQEDKDWLDTVLGDQAAFVAGLKQLGFNETNVKEGLKHFDEARQLATRGSRVETWSIPTDKRSAFKSFLYSHIAKSRLANWTQILDQRIEHTTTHQVRIPLFKLHSPKVARSKVSYVERQTDSSLAPWSVTVIGTGMGRTRKFALHHKQTFDSANGDCKLISVPVEIKVEKVTTYVLGKMIGQGFRSELVLEGVKRCSNSIDSIPDEECSRELNTTEKFDYEVEFSGDHSNAIHKIEWTETWSDTTEVKLGLKAFKTTIECKSIVQRDREIGLLFELPAGHKYELKKCREVRGVVWTVDRRESDDVAFEHLVTASTNKPVEPVISASAEVSTEEQADAIVAVVEKLGSAAIEQKDDSVIATLAEVSTEQTEPLVAVSHKASYEGRSETGEASRFQELIQMVGDKLSKLWKALTKP
ncbi:MAG TPA: hypothetical protein VJU86_12160 [Pyrinomonadaceae bacterium]|nr:hypothetical protein [Pyrinomonadaceae bacterium]